MAAAPQPAPHPAPAIASTRKTLVFANDKSSGKTTTANAVLVSLLDRYPMLMRTVAVREYDRQPRLATIFRKEDGLASMGHFNARNAQAYDDARQIADDPNATPWDDLLFSLGAGSLVVDLGANIFADICRILDEEPRPIFPDGGEMIGLVVPVTTAADSIESAIAAIEAGLGWGPKVAVFAIEQEYLGRFDAAPADWTAFRDRMIATEGARFQVVRIEKLQVADIGGSCSSASTAWWRKRRACCGPPGWRGPIISVPSARRGPRWPGVRRLWGRAAGRRLVRPLKRPGALPLDPIKGGAF